MVQYYVYQYKGFNKNEAIIFKGVLRFIKNVGFKTLLIILLFFSYKIMNQLQTSQRQGIPLSREEVTQQSQGLSHQYSLSEIQIKMRRYQELSRQNQSQTNLTQLLISIVLILILFFAVGYYTQEKKEALITEQRGQLEMQSGFDEIMKGLTDIKSEIANVNQNIAKSNKITADTEKNGGNDQAEQGELYQLDQALFDVLPESNETYVSQDYLFKIPKKIWIFSQKPNNYLEELYLKNNYYFAKQKSYQVIVVDQSNFTAYLPSNKSKELSRLFAELKGRVATGFGGNLHNHIYDIKKQLILMNLLNEHGGIITTGNIAMAENLSWINTITANPYVNRGNRIVRPQIIGFYSPYYTPKKSKQRIRPFRGMSQVDRYVTVYPSLEKFFIAAEKGTQFLTEVIPKMYSLLSNPSDFAQERPEYVLRNFNGEDMYYEYFFIAVQAILQGRQKKIDANKIDRYRYFAIDYYGLNLMNSYYGPYKIYTFWNKDYPRKAFQSLTRYTEEELFANIGPLRYIVKVTPEHEMNRYLEEAKKGASKPIMFGSFLQRIFFQEEGNVSYIVHNKQKPFVNATNEEWSSLPKIIWVFWDKGLAKAKVNNQICVQNLKRMGNISGFTVNEVNATNINYYLDVDTIDKIEVTVAKSKLVTYPTTKSDLYRLALLIKYGGIYMDASYIAVQSFDWLVNIGKYPSQYIFNRYGHLPKVFMLWHPHYASPHTWDINEKSLTKTQWLLAYENNFIAAEKGNELIRDWFDLLIELYGKPYSWARQIFTNCQILQNRWTNANFHYLVPMDAVKCAIGRRQLEIAKQGKSQWEDASDYYRIWSMSGYLGQQKFRENNNFENKGSQDNYFLYRYSQEYAEGLIGKIRHITKFYSQNNEEMSSFIARHMDGNFTNDVHPESVFMKHMWRRSFRLEEVENAVQLRAQ